MFKLLLWLIKALLLYSNLNGLCCKYCNIKKIHDFQIVLDIVLNVLLVFVHVPLASPLKVKVKSPRCHFISVKSTSVLSILLRGHNK